MGRGHRLPEPFSVREAGNLESGNFVQLFPSLALFLGHGDTGVYPLALISFFSFFVYEGVNWGRTMSEL